MRKRKDHFVLPRQDIALCGKVIGNKTYHIKWCDCEKCIKILKENREDIIEILETFYNHGITTTRSMEITIMTMKSWRRVCSI